MLNHEFQKRYGDFAEQRQRSDSLTPEYDALLKKHIQENGASPVSGPREHDVQRPTRFKVQDATDDGILYWFVEDLRHPDAARYKDGRYEPYPIARFPWGPEGEIDAQAFAAMKDRAAFEAERSVRDAQQKDTPEWVGMP